MSSVIDTIRQLLERPAQTEPSVVVPLDDPSIDRLDVYKRQVWDNVFIFSVV